MDYVSWDEPKPKRYKFRRVFRLPRRTVLGVWLSTDGNEQAIKLYGLSDASIRTYVAGTQLQPHFLYMKNGPSWLLLSNFHWPKPPSVIASGRRRCLIYRLQTIPVGIVVRRNTFNYQLCSFGHCARSTDAQQYQTVVLDH